MTEALQKEDPVQQEEVKVDATNENQVPEIELEVVDEVNTSDASQVDEKPVAEEKKPFDPKSDRVDFTTPEQQEKFDYVYKQVKMSDARNQMLTDLLQEQQRQLDELKARNSKDDSATAEAMLTAKIKQARDAGDDLAEVNAFKEYAEFIADKKLAERSTPAKPVQPQVNDMQDVGYVASLMQEKDPSGNVLRPWLHEGHQDFEKALGALQTISAKYVGDPQAVPKSLLELDNVMRSRMSTPKQPAQQAPNNRAPNPMQGSNLTNTKQRATIKMTRQELEIAKKLGVDPKKYAERRDELKGKKQ
jgi:hypothetical protein